MPNVYHFDNDGFYTGMSAADPDPLQPDNWLWPTNSALSAPPETGAHEIARFAEGAWAVVPDFVGVLYWLAGTQHTITGRGVALPEGATLTKPQAVIDAEAQALAARTFTFVDNMSFPPVDVAVLADQAELDRLTLQYRQAELAGLAAVVARIGGEDYTITMASFADLLAEYAQTMQFFALRGTGVVQQIMAALNTATTVELKAGTPALPVLGSKDAKVAAIQVSNHAAAFKAAFPDLSVASETMVVNWVATQRAVPFIAGT